MTKEQKDLSSFVIARLRKEASVSEQQIVEWVDKFLGIFSYTLTEDEKDEVIQDIQSKMHIKMERGACVQEKGHKSWYYAARGENDSVFWDRYRAYLVNDQGWAPKVIDELDTATNEIMDLLGNPKQSEGFQRRGLCIGEVQSGKTSNYIALINKAADAGYRVFFLLTGVIEKLRSQTQERIDLGFTGRDSDAFLKPGADGSQSSAIGVSEFNSEKECMAITTKSSDFRINSARTIIGKLENFNSPVVFVLKKNKSVLTNLKKWLETFNLDTNGKVNLPLLLIDDEADNASVNTKDDDSSTAINTCIRQLLGLFSKASYVGFTATPYANIFIDPDTDDEMLGDDLFPRDFIYQLTAPSNYIGAESVFMEPLNEEERVKYPDEANIGKYHCLLRNNDDCEEYLPLKHKKTARLGELPESLKQAILSFFIANTIRDLRGDKTKHRTMMINISRFISVQNRIARQVNSFVLQFQRTVKNYYKMGDKALQYPEFQELKKVYDSDFKGFAITGETSRISYDWSDIQNGLNAAIAPIHVEAVNGGNASKKLDYEKSKDTGDRLIAVGGLSLSRGLTLEGLCTSYFYRNSKMYDTLLQMGRWFGYRPNYDDLCRIWMSEESVDWYQQITEATLELHRRIIRMQNEGDTPIDFGLCVRQDKTALIVTARNKMRTAKDYVRTVVLSGSVIDTKYISAKSNVIKNNLNYTKSFIEELLHKYGQPVDTKNLARKNIQFLNVDSQDVLDFLSLYQSHILNTDFQPDDLKHVFTDYGHDFPKWDIAIAQGKGKLYDLGGTRIPLVIRGFSYLKDKEVLQMSGKSAHLADKGMSRAGLTKEQANDIEKKNFDMTHKSDSAETYFQPGIKRNPLLVIYPVELNAENKLTVEKQDIAAKISVPLIGLSIGIPSINGQRAVKHNYKINKVMQRQIMELKGDLTNAGDDFEETDETIPEDDR
ncbi:Z1 domain-containing protein [uncultured Dialister sp.]|uniref:Z1 domain-containing protein n=1 Tax=uncultured Dialister sp. TaxID=278064 RepID=UPI00261F7119|nr:Z1 domain-containing protein [uncultured Dialister sp.]